MKLKRTGFAFILLLFFFSSFRAGAQRIYMDSANTGASWDSPPEGLFNITILTFLNTKTVQLKYSNNLIGPGVTTYIKGSAGSLFGLTVEAQNSATPSQSVNVPYQIVNYGNETYLAITPDITYNLLKITVPPFSYLEAEYAFKNEQIDCGAGFSTTNARTSTAGVTIHPNSKVTNDWYAIDSDNSTSSKIFVAAQQKNVTVSQTVYFRDQGTSADMVRLYLSEVAGSSRNSSQATVQLFLNGNPVAGPTSVFSQVPVNGTTVPFDIIPNASFDQVTISVTLASNANQNYGLNVFEVQMLPKKPTLGLASTQFCQGASGTITVSNPVSGLQYKWYDGGVQITNPLPTSYVPTNLSVGSHVLTVTASRPGCPESAPATVTINVNPKPITPIINPIP